MTYGYLGLAYLGFPPPQYIRPCEPTWVALPTDGNFLLLPPLRTHPEQETVRDFSLSRIILGLNQPLSDQKVADFLTSAKTS